MKVIEKIIINVCGWNRLKIRCENYIEGIQKCWNRATKLVIIQQNSASSDLRRIWICDNCFNIKFLNDNKFTDQLLQETNLKIKIMTLSINWDWIERLAIVRKK